MAEVREWTAQLNVPLMPWLCEAIEIQLRYEQAVPRCKRCGSVDMAYGWEDSPTGVTAPDGGCETRWEEYRQCGRCGHRQAYE
jgi:ribosomal protein S14